MTLPVIILLVSILAKPGSMRSGVHLPNAEYNNHGSKYYYG